MHKHEWCFDPDDNLFICTDCPDETTTDFVILTIADAENRLNTVEELRTLYTETLPYAMRTYPEMVFNKSTPALPHLCNIVEQFMTIMRDWRKETK